MTFQQVGHRLPLAGPADRGNLFAGHRHRPTGQGRAKDLRNIIARVDRRSRQVEDNEFDHAYCRGFSGIVKT